MTGRLKVSQSSPERASDGAPFAKTKHKLLRALRARGIAAVKIEYDGYGDQGQIESIVALNASDRRVPLNRPTRLVLREGNPPTLYPSLEEAIDDFGWMILQHFHGGFEDNDGGFGTITIDVPRGTVSLDHDDRFTDTVNSRTEL
jgi:hypothetical protein